MDDSAVNVAPKNRATIRATPGQLTILRNAYEHVVVPSSQQKKSLSEQTGLPPKWIGQWFCRQRNRDRPGGANDKRWSVTAEISSTPTPEPVHESASVASFSMGPAFSVFHQESKNIKLECLDSASSPSPSGNGVSTDSITFGSTLGTSMLIDDCDDGLLIADSVKDKAKPVASQKRKLALPKARATITPFEMTPTQAGMTEVSTLTERANRRELGESTNNLDLPAFFANQHLAGTTSASAYIQHPSAKEQSVSIVKLQEACFTSTTPPRRSPPLTRRANPSCGNKNKSASRNRPSRLSVVILPEEDVEAPSELAYHHDLSLAPSHVVPSSMPVYHSQWQNNEPEFFSQFSQELSAQMTDAVTSTPDSDCTLITASSTAQSRIPSVVQSLVPANADASALLMDCFNMSFLLKEVEPSFMTGLQSEIMKSNFPQQVKAESYPEISESNLYEQLDVLDPSRAPLKHLTGILADFRSEDGSYWNLLVDAEIRSKLVDCLANEELLLKNPFVGAMGLSLLSRLGLL